MNPDRYQQAWQAHSAETRVTIHAELLRKEVQRHQGNFLATIYWRDFREVGLALLMLPLWVFLGSKFSPPWTFYLSIPAIIWGAGFILVDRIRHPQKPSEPGETLVHCVKESLKQVEHQIWLLRNVFWWYLLPYSIPILIFFAHVCWLSASVWWEFAGGFLGFSVFVFVLYALLYYMNQYAVRTQLEPRRQELLTLLSSLGDEAGRAGDNDADAYEIVPASVSPFSEEQLPAPRNAAFRNVIAIVCVVGLLTLIVPLLDLARQQSSDSIPEGAPRVSRTTGEPLEPLEKLVSDLRREKNLIGLAAMVMVDGEVLASAVDGQRMNGRDVRLEIKDRWHVGGVTNSITATMIARLVESGQMKWTDTVGEVFNEAPVHDDWRAVTIRQLLTHTAGAPKSFSVEVRKNRPAFGPECSQARLEAVLDVIKDQPTHPAGTKFGYSNVGVTIAGAIAEKLTGTTWEDLVQRNVFEPLELASAGFGPPKSSNAMLEQPRGHITRLKRKIGVPEDADNTAIMAPSGAVHMTLRDLCIYATEHLRGELGESVPVASELAESEPDESELGISEFLSSETYSSLHTPELAGYACGWIKAEPTAEIPYAVYWHNGSNTMWYAFVAFIPETRMVVAVTSNDGDVKGAGAAAWEILSDVIKSDPRPNYSRRSPFSAVRWQEFQPEVMLDNEWFKLASLNEIPAMDIVEYSQANYGERWQKRFEEDLVELLTRMGHPPQDTVTLEIQSLETDEISVRQEVPMTEANRKLIRNAAQEKSTSAQ